MIAGKRGVGKRTIRDSWAMHSRQQRLDHLRDLLNIDIADLDIHKNTGQVDEYLLKSNKDGEFNFILVDPEQLISAENQRLLRNACVVVCVFDISDPASFHAAIELKKALQNVVSRIFIFLANFTNFGVLRSILMILYDF